VRELEYIITDVRCVMIDLTVWIQCRTRIDGAKLGHSVYALCTSVACASRVKTGVLTHLSDDHIPWRLPAL